MAVRLLALSAGLVERRVTVQLEGLGKLKNVAIDIKINIQTCRTEPPLTKINSISEIFRIYRWNNFRITVSHAFIGLRHYDTITLQMAPSSNMLNDILM
jgi:hypothetical protein